MQDLHQNYSGCESSRKTAAYILEGLSKADIRKIAWEENIYQVKAEYRAYEVLNGTYRRVSALPEVVLQTFITCDVETAKILNLIAILMDSRLFFEFLHEVYDEKIRLGEKEITDRDLNVFFADKAMQSDVVAGWTDTAVQKLKQCFTRMMFEADGQIRSVKEVLKDYFGFSVSSDDDDTIMRNFKNKAQDKLETFGEIMIEYRVNPEAAMQILNGTGEEESGRTSGHQRAGRVL